MIQQRRQPAPHPFDLSPPPRLAHAARVPCSDCGYDLAGVPPRARCPECGGSGPDLGLRRRPRLFIRRLHRAAALLVPSIALLIVAAYFTWPQVLCLSHMPAPAERLIAALALAAHTGLVVAVWKLARPAARRDLRLALRHRWLILIASACTLCGVLGSQSLLGPAIGASSISMAAAGPGGLVPPFSPERTLGLVFAGLAASGQAIAGFVIAHRIAILARNLPDSELELAARRLLWLGPLLFTLGVALCGMGPVFALFALFTQSNQLRLGLAELPQLTTPRPHPRA